MHYIAGSQAPWHLRMLAWLYGMAVDMRLWWYVTGLKRGKVLDVPVISVGNLTTGGTGKTPIVIAMAQFLEGLGHRVAVLSRGYGAARKSGFHEADHPDYGDEAYLIQQYLSEGKVFVGRNRRQVAQRVLKQFKPTVILLDDGYQYLPLGRVLNILLIDGSRGFGNRQLLPSGPLREPVFELNRAQWILLTKRIDPAMRDALWSEFRAQRLTEPIVVRECPFNASGLRHAVSGEPVSPEILQQRTYWLLSGIAQPEDFRQSALAMLGPDPLRHIILEDHAVFDSRIQGQIQSCMQDFPDAVMVTTTKDWVKLSRQDNWMPLEQVYILETAPVFNWAEVLAPFGLAEPLAHVR